MGQPNEEVFIEIQKVGSGLEVRAVAGSDGLEVSFIAPLNASQAQIEQLSLAKLAYVRRKVTGGAGEDGSGPGGRGGLIA